MKRGHAEEDELSCPVCFDTLKEPHMTRCGHSFCYSCLNQSLRIKASCPKCSFDLHPDKDVYPNFTLHRIIAKRLKNADAQISTSNLSIGDVNRLLKSLHHRKKELENESFLTQNELLSEFLSHLKAEKDAELLRIRRESEVIQADLDHVNRILEEHKAKEDSVLGGEENNVVPSLESSSLDTDATNTLQTQQPESSFPMRRRKMHKHILDLSSAYYSSRAKEMSFTPEECASSLDYSGLKDFSVCLNKFTKYTCVKPLATLSYMTDMFNNASIVSSIDFDKDNEFFAIGGVTKRIKIYDYSTVLNDMVDIHYPSMEMVSSSKISCISWSSFHKGTLVSSDYEGSVVVWDANANSKVRTFQEHEKRCWSVDFNRIDTKLVASGSDDARVKLWSTNIHHSVASLEAKANVCCVKFNPESCYHLAFGSADHCVHYYDLRHTKKPLNLFKGHRKAVSYVKFLNAHDLVSASTDSHLKLWNVNRSDCIRSFTGHSNEKNFVGLATDGDYITCGSENNDLFVYYKGLSKSLFSFKFDSVKTFLDRNTREDGLNEFVSAVCWRQGTNVVLCANSQGVIKVLELT